MCTVSRAVGLEEGGGAKEGEKGGVTRVRTARAKAGRTVEQRLAGLSVQDKGGPARGAGPKPKEALRWDVGGEGAETIRATELCLSDFLPERLPERWTLCSS